MTRFPLLNQAYPSAIRKNHEANKHQHGDKGDDCRINDSTGLLKRDDRDG